MDSLGPGLSACSASIGTTSAWGQERAAILGIPSKGTGGSHRDNPCPPTIFNVVIYAVILHWVMEVSGEELGMDGFRRVAGNMVNFLYGGDGLLDSTWA